MSLYQDQKTQISGFLGSTQQQFANEANATLTQNPPVSLPYKTQQKELMLQPEPSLIVEEHKKSQGHRLRECEPFELKGVSLVRLPQMLPQKSEIFSSDPLSQVPAG